MKTNNYQKRMIWIAVLPLFAMACSLLSPVSAAPIRPVKNTPAAVQQPAAIATRQPAVQGEQPAAEPISGQPNVAPANLPTVSSNEDQVLEALYQRANPAVVSIVTYASQGSFLAAAGQGSGFVYDGEGHIVTNSHVVQGADALDVVFSDGTTLTGEVVGQDLHSDLAVVKVDQLPDGVQPLPIADMGTVIVGETVVAIGNPFGLGGTLTRGIVSAMGRTIPALTSFSIPQAIQTDAPINPGNSGGPLLNLRGEVIGVNAQIETGGTSRANSGVGFAIPSSIVARVVPGLIENGKFEWGWLGVVGGSLNQTLVKAMNLPTNKGAYVSQVVDGGPADKAGLHGASGQKTVDGRRVEVGGDVIVAIDGTPVANFEDILMYIALNTQPGQSVTLSILRNGKSQDVQLTLEPRPAEESLQQQQQQQPPVFP